MLIGPDTVTEPRRRHGHGHSRVLLARTRSRLPRLRLAGLEADAVLADRRALRTHARACMWVGVFVGVHGLCA